MEPRPFSHGYVDLAQGVWLDYIGPSMEPRPFSHGYTDCPHYMRPSPFSFNGATTFQPWILNIGMSAIDKQDGLQWSHDLSAMDTADHSDAPNALTAPFNGATTFQPWILGGPYVDMRSQGIPSMEPRPFSHGYRCCEDEAAEGCRPSMEPRPFSHGYLIRRERPTCRLSPFNGATTFQPWILGKRQ